MTNPIAARQDDSFMAICTAPSFNKTASGAIIPYIVSAKLGNSINTSRNVNFNGNAAYILDQTTQSTCKGDAAGSAGGIKSGTVNGEVKPVKGSSTVRVNKRQTIRHGDPCTLNGGNCPGIYVTVPKPKGKACCDDCHDSNPPIELTEDEKRVNKQLCQALKKNFSQSSPAIDSLKKVENSGFKALSNAQKAGEIYDDVSPVLHDVAHNAEQVGADMQKAAKYTAMSVVIFPEFAPEILVVAGTMKTVGKGVELGGEILEKITTVTDGIFSGEIQIPSGGTIPGKKKKPSTNKKPPNDKKPPGDKGDKGGTTVQEEPCIVKPYSKLKCAGDYDAHHIVPDYVLRYGTRSEGEDGKNRIDGMPSFKDGPCICLKTDKIGEDAEHSDLHKKINKKNKELGKKTNNGPIGTAPIGEIIDIAVVETIKMRLECAREIKQGVDKAFKDVDPNAPGRTTYTPPKPGSDAYKATSGYRRPPTRR
jgi:hypothetical protein